MGQKTKNKVVKFWMRWAIVQLKYDLMKQLQLRKSMIST